MANLAKRVAELEEKVDRLQRLLAGREKKDVPWWDKIAGTFANDPIYEEAMRLGREYREAQRPKSSGRAKKNGRS
jgi:hypothetical protein